MHLQSRMFTTVPWPFRLGPPIYSQTKEGIGGRKTRPQRGRIQAVEERGRGRESVEWKGEEGRGRKEGMVFRKTGEERERMTFPCYRELVLKGGEEG